jgi:hypothetical protein
MRKKVTGMRSWAASITAAAVMFAPWALLLFSGGPSTTDDSWQRGLPLFPIIFLIGVFLCSSVATWLQTNGYFSYRSFTVGASVASCAVALVLLVPSLAIGSFVGLFSFRSAIVPSLAFVSVVGLSALSAAAVWWHVAGLTHNKSLNTDAPKDGAPVS